MLKKISFLLLTVILFLNTANANSLKGSQMNQFTLISSAFIPNGDIPSRYTCDADNISPPLSWKNIPAGTKSLALILDDPDAPGGNWSHWLIFNIPTNMSNLEENVRNLPAGIKLGKNSWNKVKYDGPCPPKGEHRYQFTLYALDNFLNLPEGANRSEIDNMMKGHILQKTQLVARYSRP